MRLDSSKATVTADQPAPDAQVARAILKAHGESLARFLQSILARYQEAPAKLIESITYSLMAGGKRLRPALVLETARACAGKARDGRASHPSALTAAAAIELIHTFSLVHDDLPAMDDDDLRRGRPTNHKVFGEAMAILAGDAMVTMAFELLAADAEQDVASLLTLELARASGPAGMIGGQVLDMEGVNQSLSLESLKRLHRMKTGALLVASCRMGAIASRASEEVLQQVSEYGRHLGLAFQIVDDVLDVTSTAEQLGKATGKDADKGKNTYPTLIGLQASREQAQAQLAAAIEAIDPLGAAADGLKSLARFVVDRDV